MFVMVAGKRSQVSLTQGLLQDLTTPLPAAFCSPLLQ